MSPIILLSGIFAWFSRHVPKILRFFGWERAGRLTQHDIQIELTRDDGGRVSAFNVKLRDLLVSPSGIASLLDEYRRDKTKTRWREIKKRAAANHERLEKLYGALSTVEKITFFGRYPDILNDIQRVIDAKMDFFYMQLGRYPEQPLLADDTAIDDLRQLAHAMEAGNAKVAEIQKKIGAYLDSNADELSALLKLPTSSKSRITHIEMKPIPTDDLGAKAKRETGKGAVAADKPKGKRARGER
jgi:hypothetical protein